MKSPRLTIGQALEALPDIDDLEGLRDALLHLAIEPTGAPADESYHPMDRREIEAGAVAGSVPEIVDGVRARLNRTLGATARALAALARGEVTDAALELIEAGEAEEAARRLTEAERFYAKALEIARRPKDRGAESVALRRLGRVARRRGDLAMAKRRYLEAYRVSEARQDDGEMATSALGLGNAYVDAGEWEDARQWYRTGLSHHGDVPGDEYLHFCNGLSVVERRLGNFEESAAWIRAGEAAAEVRGDSEAKSYLAHGRARLLMAAGDRGEGVKLLEEVLAGDLDDSARISGLVNLAEALIEDGDHREAWTALRSAETLALRHRVPRLLPAVYETLGKLATARREADGFVFFEQALDFVREQRLSPARFAEIQFAYGRFDQAMGNFATAVARYELAIEAYRSSGSVEEQAEAERALQRLISASTGAADAASTPSPGVRE